MSSEEFVVSNLAELRDALGHEPDALYLLSSFDAQLLADARQALRRIAAEWAMPDSPPGITGSSAAEADL
jgi:hypothetical protein